MNTYTVQSGDTLSKIGQKHGKPLQELMIINALRDPNHISVGQVIYLDKEYANSVQIAVMDWFRHPIDAFELVLKYDGKTHAVKTDERGLAPRIHTQSHKSIVEIFVLSLSNKAHKKIGEIESGLGLRWVNLRSGAIALKAKLEPHDEAASKKEFKPAHSKDKRHDGQADGKPISQGHTVKQSKSSKNSNTTVLAADFPQDLLAYFDNYKDEEPTTKDWRDAAQTAKCEVAVLKAIRQIEAPNGSFYPKKLQNGQRVPTMQFERQVFHRLTCANGPHSNTKSKTYHGEGVKGCSSPHDKYHDISWPSGFGPGGYGTYDQAYMRLANAYRLDAEAALKSVSWGGFQIMGFNHKAAGFDLLTDFVKAMCTSEREHLGAVAAFIDATPSLKKAVQNKDWATIALYYNGAEYKKFNYDTKLKAAYEQFAKEV